jgi:hypothetical protein
VYNIYRVFYDSAQGGRAMFAKRTQKGYVLAAILGAAVGGLVTLAVTRAIPKMMARMMPEMMSAMMAQTGEAGCSPAEM